MKKIIFCLCLIVVLGFGCNGPNDSHLYTIPNQSITITKVYTAKYSKVYFEWQLPLPNGQVMTLSGSNENAGYYHKVYNLRAGQILNDVTIRLHRFCEMNGSRIVPTADFSTYVSN